MLLSQSRNIDSAGNVNTKMMEHDHEVHEEQRDSDEHKEQVDNVQSFHAQLSEFPHGQSQMNQCGNTASEQRDSWCDASKTRGLTRRNTRTSIIEHFSRSIHSLGKVTDGSMMIVDHLIFELVVCIVLVLHAVFLGFETDADTPWLACKMVLCAFWASEGGLKIRCYGPKPYFSSFGNIFDFTLVLVEMLELILSFVPTVGEGATGARFQIFRLLRLARCFRLVKMFPRLRVIIEGLIESLKALSWTLFLTVLVIYVFAMFFTDFVGKACGSKQYEGEETDCEEKYGSLAKSTYTLFEVMTLELTTVRWIMMRSPSMIIPMTAFIMIASFGIMNTIIGVVVEKILQASSNSKERKAEVRDRRTLREVFSWADVDNSKSVSHEEFLKVAESEAIKELFEQINLPLSRQRLAGRLFDVLDGDRSGKLTVDGFVERCISLKREGRSQTTDMTVMLMEVRHNHRQIEQVDQRVERVEKTMLDILESMGNVQAQLSSERLARI